MRRPRRASFELAGVEVAAGRAATVEVPIPRLVTGAQVSLPVRVFHGREEGPAGWLSAAIHGDEIGGVAIIRRVNGRLVPRRLRGTVLAAWFILGVTLRYAFAKQR